MRQRRRRSGVDVSKIVVVAFVHLVLVFIFIFFYTSAIEEDNKKLEKKSQTETSSCFDYKEEPPKPYTSMEDALGDLALAVRMSIRGVEINDDPAHYQSSSAAAHCEEDGKICIKSGALKDFPAYLLHEGAHAYTYELARREGAAKIDRELNVIFLVPTGDYGLGCVSKNSYAYEVLADFLTNIHLALRGLRSCFDGIDQFQFRSFYLDQFDYLRRKGFVTEENCRRFLQKKGY